MESRPAPSALALSLALVSLGACKSATAPPSSSHCYTWQGNTYSWTVALAVSSDTVPVINWAPADCAITELEITRVIGTCQWVCTGGDWLNPPSCGYYGCQVERTWWIESDTAPLSATHLVRSANIYPPVRYGFSPVSAIEMMQSGIVGIGDTLWIVVIGPPPTERYSSPGLSEKFVVGRGLLPH
jgi:hypothetical protein